MSAETHTNIYWAPEAIVTTPSITGYEQELSDLWKPDQALTVDNRPRLSVATAIFVSNTIAEQDLAEGNLPEHTPLIPQIPLAQSIRAFWHEMLEAGPGQSEKIAATYFAALREHRTLVYRYTTQVRATMYLSQILRNTGHTLAPCPTDVLIGYSKVFDELRD